MKPGSTHKHTDKHTDKRKRQAQHYTGVDYQNREEGVTTNHCNQTQAVRLQLGAAGNTRTVQYNTHQSSTNSCPANQLPATHEVEVLTTLANQRLGFCHVFLQEQSARGSRVT